MRDLVAVDLQASTRVDAAQILYKCGWSPFEGTDVPLAHRADRAERLGKAPRRRRVRSRAAQALEIKTD